MAYLGRRNSIPALRETPQGFYLDGGPHGEILLPSSLIPKGAEIDDVLDVFVYCDSEDRLIATTETPYVTVGQIASLEVVEVNDRVGAFLDWGLSKDLLLPFREQRRSVRVGDRVVVYVYVDDANNRIVATSKLKGKIRHDNPRYFVTQEVDMIIADETPMGYRVIVDGQFEGMLYHSELSEDLEYGQQLRGFVRKVRPDGKMDLRRDKWGHERVGPLGSRILEELIAAGGNLPYHDKSDPDDIRRAFDSSKKAFKQAIGSLYKEQRITIDESGIHLVDEKVPKKPRPPAKKRSSESGVPKRAGPPSPWDSARPKRERS